MSEQQHEKNQHDHDRRVEDILKRARRETGLRDLLSFGLAKMWTALLVLGAICHVLVGTWFLRPKTSQTNPAQSPDPNKLT